MSIEYPHDMPITWLVAPFFLRHRPTAAPTTPPASGGHRAGADVHCLAEPLHLDAARPWRCLLWKSFMMFSGVWNTIYIYNIL